MVYYDLGIFSSFGDRRGGQKWPPLAVRVTKISVAVRVLRNFLLTCSRFHVIGLLVQTGNDVIVVSAIR